MHGYLMIEMNKRASAKTGDVAASSKLEKINQEYIPDFLQMQRFMDV